MITVRLRLIKIGGLGRVLRRLCAGVMSMPLLAVSMEKVNGFRLFDRSLSGGEIFDAASAALQRLIIQLDDEPDTTDSALSLYQFPSPASFNTTWIELPRGSADPIEVNKPPTEVNNPTGKSWDEIFASLGDGVVIELVGTGNGDDVGLYR